MEFVTEESPQFEKKIYQITPRKYRPQTFDQIIGQEATVTTLKNSLQSQRLAHAYLFCGSRGTGKTTLARLFAKALNCRARTSSQEPCNTCPSCLEISSGRSLDVLEIDGASNRGIDDIRQINETISYAPASGIFKIYIIDEVHMLTKEAFNALLKTVEEPPAHVKFFFATTEPHKVPSTISSRCQRYDLNRIPLEAMASKLKSIAHDLQVEIHDDALLLIAKMSEGSLRDAESLFDQVVSYASPPIFLDQISAALGLMPRAVFFDLDRAIQNSNFSYAFELAEQIFASGKDMNHFLEDLLEHYRNILTFKLNGGRCFSLSEQDLQNYSKSAASYTEEHCLYITDYLIHWIQQVSRSPFRRVGLEMILLHLIRSSNRVPIEQLVKRLCDLENSLKESDPEPSPPPKVTATLEEKLLTAIISKKEEEPPAPLPSPLPQPDAHPSKYDTLMRFAAVELEGTIKNS